jgi:hypothetical protein
MDISYSPRIKQWKDGCAFAQKTTGVLEEVLGGSVARVNGEWDRTEEEHGQPQVVLRIKDATGEADTSFRPDEFNSPLHVKIRLHQLWDRLLAQRLEHLRQESLAGSAEA